MRAKSERTRPSQAEKRKVTKTLPSEEAKASAPELTVKLHFHQKARLQGWVMRAKAERTRPSQAEKHKVTKTPPSEEAKASAPEATLKLHFHRKARLQERVPQNKRNLLHRWATSVCPVATTLTRKERNIGSLSLIWDSQRSQVSRLGMLL